VGDDGSRRCAISISFSRPWASRSRGGWWAASSTPERRRLELRLDFPRGARFACPEGDHEQCEVHDTDEKSWRHLDFFQHEAHLTARVPRVRCPEHGVRQVSLPWARPGSGFTLLFEALVMALVSEMPVRAVASLISEHDTRVWRVVHHYVEQARVDQDLSGVERDRGALRPRQALHRARARRSRPRSQPDAAALRRTVFGAACSWCI
jgi:hypothetical protein